MQNIGVCFVWVSGPKGAKSVGAIRRGTRLKVSKSVWRLRGPHRARQLMGGSWSGSKWSRPGKFFQEPAEGATGLSASSKELLETGFVPFGYTRDVLSRTTSNVGRWQKRFLFSRRKQSVWYFLAYFQSKVFSSYFSDSRTSPASDADGNQASIMQRIWPQDQSRVENRNHIDMSTNGTWIGQNTIPLGHVPGRPRSQLGLRGYRSCSGRTVRSFGSRSRVIKWSMDAE